MWQVSMHVYVLATHRILLCSLLSYKCVWQGIPDIDPPADPAAPADPVAPAGPAVPSAVPSAAGSTPAAEPASESSMETGGESASETTPTTAQGEMTPSNAKQNHNTDEHQEVLCGHRHTCLFIYLFFIVTNFYYP